GRGRILWTPPAAAAHRNTAACQAVDRRECEAFGLSVVPAQAGKNADIVGQFLFDVQARTVLQRSRLARGRDVGNGVLDFALADRLRVRSGTRVQREPQEPRGSRMP